MILNKDICKRCIGETCNIEWGDYYKERDWLKIVEKWDNTCFLNQVNEVSQEIIGKNIYYTCKYKLEHIVMENQNVK